MKVYALIAAIALCAGSAKAELIVNGDFETGDFTGWTVHANGSNPQMTVVSEPFAADLSSHAPSIGGWGSPGEFEQTIPTALGQYYTLNFELWNQQWVAQSYFEVRADNTVLLGHYGQSVADWTPFSLNFEGAGSTATIKFAGDYTNVYVDNISVVPVPEPAALAVGGASCGLLIKRRRTR